MQYHAVHYRCGNGLYNVAAERGGSGGTGGKDSANRTDLAGSTLDSTVGARGAAYTGDDYADSASGTVHGQPGRVVIQTY